MISSLTSLKRGETVEELVVATIGTTNDEVFHWQMYLFTENEDSCILINMSLGLWVSDGTKGTLKIDNKVYGLSSSVIDKIILKVEGNLKVGDFESLIVRNGYHRYNFAEGGYGCRYWIERTISLFEESGMLPTGQSDILKNGILEIASRYPDKVSFPFIQGTFY